LRTYGTMAAIAWCVNNCCQFLLRKLPSTCINEFIMLPCCTFMKQTPMHTINRSKNKEMFHDIPKQVARCIMAQMLFKWSPSKDIDKYSRY
jgi:hypothetical protein